MMLWLNSSIGLTGKRLKELSGPFGCTGWGLIALFTVLELLSSQEFGG
jgi:hypothetical protein